MHQQDLLVAQDISKTFPGTRALDHVTLRVRPGEVHAVIGENGAGKSTLMNIIGGVFAPDSGKIYVDGNELIQNNGPDPARSGVSIVHQELAVCPQLSVMNNIFMGRLQTHGPGLISEAAMNARTDELLRPFHTSIKATDIIGRLTIAQQQVVEIAKAISYDCKVLILDEPTSSLTDSETLILFDLIRQLKSQGISVLYISHRMNEIFTICDRATVLRDGQWVDTVELSEVTEEDLISKMVGRTLDGLYPAKSDAVGQSLLSAADISDGRTCRNVAFELHRGEILGFYGLVGAGRSEMARVLCGIDRGTSRATLDGQEVSFSNYQAAIDAGLVYVTEDRKNEGLFLNLGISKNMTAAIIGRISRGLLLDRNKEQSLAQQYVETLGVKTPTVTQPIWTLSGGNQQKAMIGKWLSASPKVIILDEPTRGIDIVAKSEVHQLLRDICTQGIGVIVISSDLPEIIGVCDRVAVMNQGTITGCLSGSEINEETIMKLAAQH